MTSDEMNSELTKLGACREGISWARGKDPDEAWATCERGDWMLWIVGKLSGGPDSSSRKTLVQCACECARLALPYVLEGDKRPEKAIEAAEEWAGGGGLTLKDVKKASYPASAAAYTAAAAAYAAANTVYADANIEAIASGADAYDGVAYAASAVAARTATAAAAAAEDPESAAEAREITLLECAEIVRQHYPEAPVIEE